ncbi:MAG: hypothetical protein ACQEUD_07060 [Bacillota bacterium]
MWGKRWKWKFEWSGALNLGFGAFFVLWGWFAGGSAGGYLRVSEFICEFWDIFATLLGLFASFRLYLRLGAVGVAQLRGRLAGRELLPGGY